MWVIDWYNYIVQHNPTPPGFQTGKGNAYVTPLRDKKHGRIYRIVNETAKLSPKLDLDKATPEQLVAALKNDNMFWRLQAQWRLVERGKADVLAGAGRAGADQQRCRRRESAGPPCPLDNARPGRVRPIPMQRPRGICSTSSEARLGGSSVVPLLGVLPRSEDSVKAILKADLLKDREPLVRRAALLALSEMPPSKEAGAAIHALLMAPRTTKTAGYRWPRPAPPRAHDAGFLAAALAAKTNTEPVRRVVRIVAEHYVRGDASETVSDLLNRLKDARSRRRRRSARRSRRRLAEDKAPKLDEQARAMTSSP